jgi:hypothetical protein
MAVGKGETGRRGYKDRKEEGEGARKGKGKGEGRRSSKGKRKKWERGWA